MSAIKNVQTRVQQLISSVSELELIREWYKLQSSEDLAAWVDFLMRIETNSNESTDLKTQVQTTLKENIPFFEKNPGIFKDLDIDESDSESKSESDFSSPKTKLIAGHVQSGKSAVICGLAVYMVKVLKKPVVIVVRNYTADYKQLASKFDRNGSFEEFDVLVHYAKDVNSNQIFHPNYPAITICLEHQTQLRKLIESHRNRPEAFCLIADEADAICYKQYDDRERIAQFTELWSRAQQFIAITATAFDMLYMESRLDNQSIYQLPVPEFYKGIQHPDFSFGVLPQKFDFNLSNISPSVAKLSDDMEAFYLDLLDTPTFELDDGYHPVICLQKTESVIRKQVQSLAALARHPVFGEEFIVMTYNGDGVYLYAPFDIGRTIAETHGADIKLVYLSDIRNVFHYKDLGIHHILQHLKDLNQPDRIKHIVIIGGQMVSRGLNIVSTDYQWHLTHQIYKTSAQSTCAEDIQGCRIFGVYRDNIPTRLYCLQKDINNITQAQHLQERIYEGASFHQLTESLPQLCEKIKVFKGLIPRKRTTKKCMEPQWKKVQSERAQYEEVQERESKEEDGSGWLVYQTSEIQKKAYQDIEKVLLDQGWINMWIKRSDIQTYIPEREWDLRDLKHNSSRIGETRIQYRKINGRVEYKLLR